MKKAFTIIELVIAVAIISILSAVLIPSIVNGDTLFTRLQAMQKTANLSVYRLTEII